jgi:hypothetical protein
LAVALVSVKTEIKIGNCNIIINNIHFTKLTTNTLVIQAICYCYNVTSAPTVPPHFSFVLYICAVMVTDPHVNKVTTTTTTTTTTIIKHPDPVCRLSVRDSFNLWQLSATQNGAPNGKSRNEATRTRTRPYQFPLVLLNRPAVHSKQQPVMTLHDDPQISFE